MVHSLKWNKALGSNPGDYWIVPNMYHLQATKELPSKTMTINQKK